jgi:hypothetical protein
MISEGVLAYVIRIPLTDHTHFNVYKLIPFPIVLDSKCIFIQPEKPYLLMDVAKQYYCKLDKYEFEKCKVLTDNWRVCKQDFLVQSTHFKKECEAQMLQPIKSVPADCSQRLIELNETLWTQLDNDEWLFVAPKAERLTIICKGHEAVDEILKGSGKVSFFKYCRGYSGKVMIQAHVTVSTNFTNRDVIPPLDLMYDCCEDEKVRLNIQELQLTSHIKNVISNVDDLQYASHKVEEVEKLINDQKWKQSHSTRLLHLSALTVIGMILIGIIILCYCCKLCMKCCPRFFHQCDDCVPCKAIIFRPSIVTKVRTSNERLSRVDEEIELNPQSSMSTPRISRRAASEPAGGKR